MIEKTQGGQRDGAGRPHEHSENVLVEFDDPEGEDDVLVIGPYLNRKGEMNQATLNRAGAIARYHVSEGMQSVRIVRRKCCVPSAQNVLIEEVTEGERETDWMFDDEMREAVEGFMALQYQERARLEKQFAREQPPSFSSEKERLAALERYHLYCSACGHDKGCAHGVPAKKPRKTK